MVVKRWERIELQPYDSAEAGALLDDAVAQLEGEGWALVDDDRYSMPILERGQASRVFWPAEPAAPEPERCPAVVPS